MTRVSARQQRQLARAVKNAREMALLPYTSAR
ncbi:ribosomal protein S18 [Streptomyces achromogenes]|uniref:Ribosomal protein S18 n=1 Tax=Streptomyces achromogenes TaxID=67255 RepID=A0ABU0Q441_STRAH|nr:ribosomal protein S18 [Streptomyces achromogenes]